MNKLTSFMRRAIGVPFVDCGRGFDGWDCYGLVVCAYREVLGVELPDYEYESKPGFHRRASAFNDRLTARWQEIPRPEVMSVAVILRRNLPIHAGLVIPGRRIMHVERGIETCHDAATEFRIEGFYVPCGGGTSSV